MEIQLRWEVARVQFEFNSGSKDYIFWAWKGGYLNLGARAEMGIYTRMEVLGAQTDHWFVDQSLAMPMTLKLDYNGKQIIAYDPKKDNLKGKAQINGGCRALIGLLKYSPVT